MGNKLGKCLAINAVASAYGISSSSLGNVNSSSRVDREAQRAAKVQERTLEALEKVGPVFKACAEQIGAALKDGMKRDIDGCCDSKVDGMDAGKEPSETMFGKTLRGHIEAVESLVKLAMYRDVHQKLKGWAVTDSDATLGTKFDSLDQDEKEKFDNFVVEFTGRHLLLSRVESTGRAKVGSQLPQELREVVDVRSMKISTASEAADYVFEPALSLQLDDAKHMIQEARNILNIRYGQMYTNDIYNGDMGNYGDLQDSGHENAAENAAEKAEKEKQLGHFATCAEAIARVESIQSQLDCVVALIMKKGLSVDELVAGLGERSMKRMIKAEVEEAKAEAKAAVDNNSYDMLLEKLKAMPRGKPVMEDLKPMLKELKPMLKEFKEKQMKQTVKKNSLFREFLALETHKDTTGSALGELTRYVEVYNISAKDGGAAIRLVNTRGDEFMSDIEQVKTKMTTKMGGIVSWDETLDSDTKNVSAEQIQDALKHVNKAQGVETTEETLLMKQVPVFMETLKGDGIECAIKKVFDNLEPMMDRMKAKFHEGAEGVEGAEGPAGIA